MVVTPKRLYYGWLVAAAASAIEYERRLPRNDVEGPQLRAAIVHVRPVAKATHAP